MLAGDDIVDLSGAAGGFDIDGGDGSDTLTGSAGSDTLTGGADADIFALNDLTTADVISDYTNATEQVDLTSLVQLTGTETIDSRVDYDDTTGELTVDTTLAATLTSDAGGLPPSVEVIFINAAGAQETAVLI